MKKILVLLCFLFSFLNIIAQEYELILDNCFQTHCIYPQNRNDFDINCKVTAFSYNRKKSLAWVYCDKFLAQVKLPESFKVLLKEHDVKDIQKKDVVAFNKRIESLKHKLDRRYYIIDSIEISRQKHINDSITRLRFITDSIENVENDTTALNYKYPFSFRLIMGTTKGRVPVSKHYVSFSFSSVYKNVYISDKRPVLIAGYVKDTTSRYYGADMPREFLRVFILGQEVFLRMRDVLLNEENKAKLDTLIKADGLSKAHFKHYTKTLANDAYYLDLKRMTDILHSYDKYPVAITEWSWGKKNEYSNYHGVDINLYNPTKKTIKYIYIMLKATNPVGDPINRSMQTVTCIGPIKPGQTASYSFDDVWYSNTIDKVKVANIKVLFMDKTTRHVNPAYPAIFSEEEKNVLENFISDEEKLNSLNEKDDM